MGLGSSTGQRQSSVLSKALHVTNVIAPTSLLSPIMTGKGYACATSEAKAQKWLTENRNGMIITGGIKSSAICYYATTLPEAEKNMPIAL